MQASADIRHQAILNTIAQIPYGKVSTYGYIAALAGYPGNARYVGRLLKELPSNTKIPWHRVLNSTGRISFPAGSEKQMEQIHRLQDEQIVVLKGRVKLATYRQV